MSDIDQQAIFDRLPLSAEQRKRLYETITGVAARTEIAIPVDSSKSQDSLVEPDRSPSPLTDSQSLQKH